MDLLKFLGYDMPTIDKHPSDKDQADLVRYFGGLERAINSATMTKGHAEDEELASEVQNVADEMGWVDTRFYEMIDEHNEMVDHAVQLEGLIDELTEELRSRLTEEELRDFEQQCVWEKLTEKKSI